MQKSFVNILIVVSIIVIAGVAGFFIFTNKPTSTIQLTPTSLPTTIPATEQTQAIQEPTSMTTISSNENAGWKIYQNQEFGFTIAYPETWQEDAISGNAEKIEGGKILYQLTECQHLAVLGAYDNLKRFSNDFAKLPDDWQSDDFITKGSFVKIGYSNFSEHPIILLSGGYDTYYVNTNNLELALNGNPSKFNEIVSGDYLQFYKEEELPNLRKLINNRWAFVTTTYQQGGPCISDGNVERFNRINQRNYSLYEFIRDGKYIAVEISTPGDQKEIHGKIISTFKFVK